MLDFFAVITKGGLVLWYFQDVAQNLNTSIDAINALIRNVILQERGGLNAYNHENLALKMKQDNKFDLLFVAVYQKILQLSYVDKFLSDIHLEFRDKYKEPLELGLFYKSFDCTNEYHELLMRAEQVSKLEKSVARAPRTFEQSDKSKKTIDSMVEKKGVEDKTKKKNKKGKNSKKEIECNNNIKYKKNELADLIENEGDERTGSTENSSPKSGSSSNSATIDEIENIDPKDQIKKKIDKKLQPKGFKAKNSKQSTKKGKEARIWEFGGTDSSSFDYSKKGNENQTSSIRPDFLPDPTKIGTLRGNLQSLQTDPAEEKKVAGSGMFGLFKSLVGGKTLTSAVLEPVLEKLKEHLIGKNVASEIAENLCQSVQLKLEGKHIGTFEGVTSLVRTTLTDALVQLLTPKRRLDILRDVTDSREARNPYVVTFCGVNGVGKSTNLAKITFWLIENGFRVLIAACDTFRAGAVEQLRTHVKHLNALHPSKQSKVELFEQGYGKDAAEIARFAVEHARKNGIEVVLIDTAGRMQDNEPLMRALAKLIHVNEPDLTLFVGEALVGNEAVDQLVKFNRALANFSTNNRAQMIDAIVLTKFDTIDDKVGAAISMTYITGQPIAFVGTGQTYTDLKSLDPRAVVGALMK